MKIVLITPYTGSNLGDAAIQEAAIHNIRVRNPHADIRMVTLSPLRTTTLHDVASFPITAIELPYYSIGISGTRDACWPERIPATGAETQVTPSGRDKLKAHVKSFPLLFALIRALAKFARRIRSLVLIPAHEVRHASGALRFIQAADAVIVSGGGQIDDAWGGPWGHPYALAKWALLSRRSGTTFSFVSVGVCTVARIASKFFFRFALRQATYRSYRDQGSKRLLSRFEFTKDDSVFPDLAHSLPPVRLPPRRQLNRESVTVAVSPIAYLRQNWPNQDPMNYRRQLNVWQAFVEQLISNGFRVRLFTTDTADIPVLNEIYDNLLMSTDVDSDRVERLTPASIDELFDFLASVDIVVASRLHGIILSHLAHKPVLAVSYDRKVLAYMSETFQEDYCLDINAVTPESMMATLACLLESHETLVDAIDTLTVERQTLLNSQYDHIIQSNSDA